MGKRTNINTNKEHLRKVEQTGSFREAFEKLKKQTPSFILHHYNKEKQSTAYLEHKEESEEGESNVSVLQIDSAENFSTFHQNESQSAHWNKTQITMFTAALCQNRECLPAVVISNDLSHSKESIMIFLEKVLSSLIQSDAKVLHIWSYGPSSQFKNCFIVNCLSWFEKDSMLKSTGIFLYQVMAKDQLTEYEVLPNESQLILLPFVKE